MTFIFPEKKMFCEKFAGKINDLWDFQMNNQQFV